jgi:hypothetical protein
MIAGCIIIISFLVGLFVALWCFFFKKVKVPIHNNDQHSILKMLGEEEDEESSSYSISNSESGYSEMASSKEGQSKKSKNISLSNLDLEEETLEESKTAGEKIDEETANHESTEQE